MQRFVCQQNVAHFRKLLDKTTDPAQRRTLEGLLTSAKRELAILESTVSGADASPIDSERRPQGNAQNIRQEFQSEFHASPHPYLLIDPAPGLHIVDLNEAYARATMINRSDVVGQSLFEIFPDNPEDSLADGVSNLYGSLRAVMKTGKPHSMAVQRYDIRDQQGQFIERHWQPVNSPVHDRDGILIYILHHVEDVTADVLSQPLTTSPSASAHPSR